jgi:hypothetical protein
MAVVQAAAASAAAVVDGMFSARKLTSRLDNAPRVGDLSCVAPAPVSALGTETLADEMSLSLTLISKITSHVFAIVEQLPDDDSDADTAADAAVDAAADATTATAGYFAAAAKATSSLQETTLRLADMCAPLPPLNSCNSRVVCLTRCHLTLWPCT